MASALPSDDAQQHEQRGSRSEVDRHIRLAAGPVQHGRAVIDQLHDALVASNILAVDAFWHHGNDQRADGCGVESAKLITRGMWNVVTQCIDDRH